MGMIELILGDITELEVDAIVNAANARLLGGGGVDGAIHRAAGAEMLEACRAVPELAPGVRCREGQAIVTPGFDLPCRIVVHTVGPVWDGGAMGEAEVLAACYRNAAAAAAEHGAGSVAFPGISTGAYGFPVDIAAPIAVEAVTAAIESHSGLERVVFCAFDDEWYDELSALLR
jgi:O-acetyl-ADP-ribose deacetylase (regulator of RNase III)